MTERLLFIPTAVRNAYMVADTSGVVGFVERVNSRWIASTRRGQAIRTNTGHVARYRSRNGAADSLIQEVRRPHAA
ncbi:hypothetical protein [Nitrolancea hollandica]|nr:hypothetical protein [Nitrolancea hollandica]